MSEQGGSEQAVKTRGNLVGDVIAGLTTGVANIPDAMASAILAGANPVQGLYATIVPIDGPLPTPREQVV